MRGSTPSPDLAATSGLRMDSEWLPGWQGPQEREREPCGLGKLKLLLLN